jgi:hypothetical protein
MADEEARDQPALTTGSPSVGGVIRQLLEAVSSRSRKEMVRAQTQGRLGMERRQLERDRSTMLAKLGRETIALLNGGEVDHPGLRRGAARIEALDAQLAALGTTDPE